MNTPLQFLAIFIVTIKRLFSQRDLVLATLLGLLIATALTMSIPLYSDAIYNRIFNEKINPNSTDNPHVLPPFALMFRYSGSLNKPVEIEDLSKVDHYLSNLDSSSFGFPDVLKVRSIKTDNFQLFSSANAKYVNVKNPLTWTSFGFITDLEPHINIVEGKFPTDSEPNSNANVNVLLSDTLAAQLGVHAGEDYIAFTNKTQQDTESVSQFPVHIAGIWKPEDPNEAYWFYMPSNYDDMLITTESTFRRRISPFIKGEVYSAVWYHVLNNSNFVISDATSFINLLSAQWRQADELLVGTRLDISPLDALISYQKEVRLLTFFLYAFSVPFLTLILAFTGLVSSLSVESRRNEIAMLRSRGTTILQLVGIAALEGILMGIAALALGTPISQLITALIGQTQSFLVFNSTPRLQVEMSWAALDSGLMIIGVALIMQIIPTLRAAQYTLVTYKMDRARSMVKPWLQRTGLDLLLLLPAVYGAYLLTQQGRIAIINAEVSTNPFQNPLLFLVPVLWIFSISLIFLRLLPILMNAISWLVSQTKSTGFLLATRYLARSPSFYTTPLLLLILTLSLSTFTASLAQTLDQSLFDQTNYKNGADLSLAEFGQNMQPASPTGNGAISTTPSSTQNTGPRWLFLPVTEYLNIPGVEKATRIGAFTAEAAVAGKQIQGSFAGIDRATFPQVSFWRRDFAPNNLGTLMNKLGATRAGLLVNTDFLSATGLGVGDSVKVVVRIYDQHPEIIFKIVDIVDYFPGWYPDKGAVFIGNLDYLFEHAGGLYPYNVLLRTSPTTTVDDISGGMNKLGLKGAIWSDTRAKIVTEQMQPNRQGLFGILTVGFISAALLTVLSFLFYALFSFRRRFIEFGVLQAIGLSPLQMGIFLASELGFLMLLGTAVGTVLGVVVSRFFIPYMQLGPDITSQIPPFQVFIAWPRIFQIYGVMALLFIFALILLIILLLKMKIFQAIKLGETV